MKKLLDYTSEEIEKVCHGMPIGSAGNRWLVDSPKDSMWHPSQYIRLISPIDGHQDAFSRSLIPSFDKGWVKDMEIKLDEYFRPVVIKKSRFENIDL